MMRDVKLIQTTAERLRGGKQFDTRRYLHFKVSVDSEQSGMVGSDEGKQTSTPMRREHKRFLLYFASLSEVPSVRRFFRGGNQLRQRF